MTTVSVLAVKRLTTGAHWSTKGRLTDSLIGPPVEGNKLKVNVTPSQPMEMSRVGAGWCGRQHDARLRYGDERKQTEWRLRG